LQKANPKGNISISHALLLDGSLERAAIPAATPSRQRGVSFGAPIDPFAPTIFHERWWLDVATNGTCRFAEVRHNGLLVGRLPYFTRKRPLQGTAIDQPPLTHFLGPAILESDGKESSRFLRRLDITRGLIEQLPSVSFTYVKCHRDITDVISFQSCNFRTSVQFTHEIEPQQIDAVWKNMRDKGRNNIRQGQRTVIVDRTLSPRRFSEFYLENIRSRGQSNHMDLDVCGRLIEAAVARERGLIFAARNAAGAIVAAIFCVWDQRSYYYLMSTRMESADRGAISLLLWEAINDSMKRGLVFDFDGVPDEGSARLFANFTPIAKPRYIAIRETKLGRIMTACKAAIRPPSPFYR
jgi:hypothetical protein